MKLRNKKTGEIYCCRNFYIDDTEDRKATSYDKLADLCNDWEDYEYVEPLIKDEKIRKAVRAWAEANEETELKATGGCLVTTFKGLNFQLEAKFRCRWMRDGVYTIAELCGEEEE